MQCSHHPMLSLLQRSKKTLLQPAPHLNTEPDTTWYRLSHWIGCLGQPNQLLLKINPTPAELRAFGNRSAFSDRHCMPPVLIKWYKAEGVIFRVICDVRWSYGIHGFLTFVGDGSGASNWCWRSYEARKVYFKHKFWGGWVPAVGLLSVGFVSHSQNAVIWLTGTCYTFFNWWNLTKWLKRTHEV